MGKISSFAFSPFPPLFSSKPVETSFPNISLPFFSRPSPFLDLPGTPRDSQYQLPKLTSTEKRAGGTGSPRWYWLYLVQLELSVVSSYRAGLAHEHTARGRSSERVYLPPPVGERILSWALALDLSEAGPHERRAFRAAVAVILTFCFFARGATGAALQAQDVRRGPEGELLVTLAHEKGKTQRARARLLTIPAGSVPGLDELLAKWEQHRGVARKGDSYYALPEERHSARDRPARFRSTQIDAWLQLLLERFGVRPPEGVSLGQGTLFARAPPAALLPSG